jgi:formylglycine-generating enzyme required for sulfatase activity
MAKRSTTVGLDVHCSEDGNDCATSGRYALSEVNAPPAVNLTWFQAQQLCANSGKRLLTNAEWQMAAAGTPNNPTDCNEATSISAENTGTHGNCVSNWKVHDMVGNVWEWVADWVLRSAADCPGWGSFSTDMMCFDGDNVNGSPDSRYAGPGALIRGGGVGLPAGTSGVFAINGINSPNLWGPTFGFRCAR